jgi:propanediol dehydratase large subunit
MMLDWQKCASEARQNQAHVTNWLEHCALLAADAAEAR